MSLKNCGLKMLFLSLAVSAFANASHAGSTDRYDISHILKVTDECFVNPAPTDQGKVNCIMKRFDGNTDNEVEQVVFRGCGLPNTKEDSSGWDPRTATLKVNCFGKTAEWLRQKWGTPPEMTHDTSAFDLYKAGLILAECQSGNYTFNLKCYKEVMGEVTSYYGIAINEGCQAMNEWSAARDLNDSKYSESAFDDSSRVQADCYHHGFDHLHNYGIPAPYVADRNGSEDKDTAANVSYLAGLAEDICQEPAGPRDKLYNQAANDSNYIPNHIAQMKNQCLDSMLNSNNNDRLHRDVIPKLLVNVRAQCHTDNSDSLSVSNIATSNACYVQKLNDLHNDQQNVNPDEIKS